MRFYTFVLFSYIFHENIGFKLDSLLDLTQGNPQNYTASYDAGAVATLLYSWYVWKRMYSPKEDLTACDVPYSVKKQIMEGSR